MWDFEPQKRSNYVGLDSNELDIKIHRFVKNLYWDFCIINKIINLDDIKLLEEQKTDVGLTLVAKVLEKSIYPEYMLSPNLFTQLCFFKEGDFNFKFLKRSGGVDSKKSKHTINFSTNDVSGKLIHYTLPAFCIKFGRTQNEMMKIILLLSLRKIGVLDSHFEFHADSRKILSEILRENMQS